ncbi:CAP domain-containing protein [Eubacterium sp. Marseille-QA0814]|uniref:CAP domain-containing protein n=1 Tax=Eubacterium sp. Marseille-QA0814 TaxID=3378778 RepID=UPI003D0D550F
MIKKKNKYLIMTMLIVTLGFCLTTKTVSAGVIGKVTHIKVSAVTKKYKTIKDASLKKTSMKYRAGYKITWKKVKNILGYKVYVYYPAVKQWKCVKTTKKNKYTLTNLLANEKVKLKVVAYKSIKNGENKQGSFSKTITVKNKSLTYVRKSNGKIKKRFHDRVAAENAFIVQNGYRAKVGAEKLEWSKALYKVCLERAKMISKNFSHDGWTDTVFNVLNKKYGIEEKYYWYEDDNCMEYGEAYAIGENIAEGSDNYKDAMKQWKNSQGHYNNLKNPSHKSGAIACYKSETGTYWVALFSDMDVDKILKETSK